MARMRDGGSSVRALCDKVPASVILQASTLAEIKRMLTLTETPVQSGRAFNPTY
jgi:hypothetical protein